MIIMRKLCILISIISSSVFAHPVQYSTTLKPAQSAEYYIDQAHKYFDTLDTYADQSSKPKYSSHVIRWEWYPWLFLTGHKDHWMWLDHLVTLYPTKVINRECEAFETQPFSRCRVTFHYLKSNSYVDIYEEFTFNKKGEITFVEAWSDLPNLLPMDPSTDYWAQAQNINRLSTKVPGLGSPSGKINRRQLKKLSKKDEDLKNLRKRLRFTIFFWTKEAIRLVIKGHGH